MRDEKFPIPEGQRVQDDIVEVPRPLEVADEMLDANQQAETPAGFYEDQARLRNRVSQDEASAVSSGAHEQAPAVESVSVDQLIEDSEAFKKLDYSLSDPELPPQEKMGLIDDFINGPASEIAHDNGVFTPEEIKALPSIQKLQMISDHLFGIFEEQGIQARSKEKAEGASKILREALDFAQKNRSNELPQTLISRLKQGLEEAKVFAPGVFDSLPEKADLVSLIFSLSLEESALQEEKSKQQSEAAQFESVLGGRPTSVESGAQKGVVQEPKPGFFSRVKESFGRIRRALSERATRFIHGDTLSINSTMASAKLDRTPREPAYPEQETPAENSAARSGEETQEIVQSVPQPEAASDPVVTESAPITEEIQSGPGFSSAEPEAPTPSEESPAAPSVEAREETVSEQPVPPSSFVERVVAQAGASVGSAESVEVRKTPEEIAFDAAVDFTAKVENFIAGMSPADYAKGYGAFFEKMSDFLATPEGVDPNAFALTQDRIMYRIARDESFPKEARQLLVQLLEKRGAVKVEDRGDGKKVIRRLVSYGETARQVITDRQNELRRLRKEMNPLGELKQ